MGAAAPCIHRHAAISSSAIVLTTRGGGCSGWCGSWWRGRHLTSFTTLLRLVLAVKQLAILLYVGQLVDLRFGQVGTPISGAAGATGAAAS